MELHSLYFWHDNVVLKLKFLLWDSMNYFKLIVLLVTEYFLGMKQELLQGQNLLELKFAMLNV